MGQCVRVTTLVENTAHGMNVLAEHGLSFWIEAGKTRVLMDTGQGKVLAANARTIEELGRFDIDLLAPGHCTGLAPIVEMWKAFHGRCAPCALGVTREFHLS